MKKRLKIGSIGKMFGLSSQALRDYAKLDVVTPARDNENNYRYYSELEVTHLIKARRLKSMGFSLAEVLAHNLKYKSGLPENTNAAYKNSMETESVSLDGWLDKLENRKDLLADEMARKEKAYQEVMQYHRQIKRIQELFGTYRIEESLEWRFFMFSNEEGEMISESKELQEFQKWADVLPSSRYAFMCRRQYMDPVSHEPMRGSIRRGLCIKSRDAEQFGLKMTERTSVFPHQKCIHTIVGQDIRKKVSAQWLYNAVDFARKNNLEVAGDAIAIWIANIKEEPCVMKYYETWIPVNEV